MAETFGSLIDYVTDQLLGFTTDTPMLATTTTVLQPSSLTVGLALPAQAQPQGLLEIDDELVHVASFDPATGTATIPPWGRGQQGTVAAPHAIGRRVTVNPRYPRHRVGQVINQVIDSMCPPLFAVQRGSFIAQPQTFEYPLPAGTRNLLRAEYRPFASSAYEWIPLRSAVIRRDSGAPVLRVDGNAFATCEVRFTVAANPTPFTAETDLFTGCGLPESVVDIVSLGALPRLVTTADLARHQLSSVEVSERTTLLPSGTGPANARFYMQMFEARLAAEAKRLRAQYPLTMMRNS